MHSQNNEEQIIKDYFKDEVGTFLDIGANDGITLSNTYALSNWKGTLVEASPKAFEKLLTTYRGKEGFDFIHAAVGTVYGNIKLYESGEHLGKGDTSLLSTIVPDEMKRWTKESFTEVLVQCMPFATMLNMADNKTFDLISMDIEGMELQVLPQMKLNELGCRMLIVEYNGKEQEKYDNIVLPQGYSLLTKNGENLIYVKR